MRKNLFLAAHSTLRRLCRRPGLTFDIYGHPNHECRILSVCVYLKKITFRHVSTYQVDFNSIIKQARPIHKNLWTFEFYADVMFSVSHIGVIAEVSGGGSLAPSKPLIMNNIFFQMESAHGIFYIP